MVKDGKDVTTGSVVRQPALESENPRMISSRALRSVSTQKMAKFSVAVES
jgi:hypothetical protein